MLWHSKDSCFAWLAGAGFSSGQLCRILESENDPRALLECFLSTGQLPGFSAIPEKMKHILKMNSSESRFDRTEEILEKHGIRTVTFLDGDYPERLSNLDDAPAVLFYQGNIKALDMTSVSMVGSRNATIRGLQATQRIAEALSERGISVVSGLACGIDAAAHKGCVKGGSPTVAVLGCGPDQNYPAENAALRKRILENQGLILSEYPPEEKPLGWHFPYRNRIISALGECLVLMEARIRSGSMTTVQHALNQGKDVFVYPGDPESPAFAGNRQLLREGAVFFTSADDLMEDMRWLDKSPHVRQNIESAAESEETFFSPLEKQILNQLEKGEQSFDQLCSGLNISAAMLSAALSMLQIRGAVCAMPGKIYTRTAEK